METEMGYEHQHDDEQVTAYRRPAARASTPDSAADAFGTLSAAGNAAVAGLLRGSVHRQGLTSQGAGPLDPEIGAAIDAERGGGAPLPEPVRADMEHHLGADLTGVRVHTGSRADTLNRAVQAEAFTTGTDIFFTGGSYDPGSSRGRELLAHELTHVVQQAGGGGTAAVSHPDDAAEVEARHIGAAVASAGPAAPVTPAETAVVKPGPARGATPGAAIHRQAAEPGAVEMKPETIRSSRRDRQEFARRRDDVVTKIELEVDRHVAAVMQGHRQGLAAYRRWYAGYVKSKEDANQQTAIKVCKFLLSKGLAIVFPEAVALNEVIKKVAEKAFELAADHLGKVDTGDVEGYLARLTEAEETAITALLDARDQFMAANEGLIDSAVVEYMARQDDPDHPFSRSAGQALPPSVAKILLEAGVGMHGGAAATAYAERWLTSHIQATFQQDTDVMGGRGGMETAVLAEITALRHIDPVKNRDRIYEMESGLPAFFRTMVDLNADNAAMIELRLGIDGDEARHVVESRRADGAFGKPEELVSRAILKDEDFRRVQGHVVAH
jgi:hypothetical protein